MSIKTKNNSTNTRASTRKRFIKWLDTLLPIIVSFIALGTSIYLVNELTAEISYFENYYFWLVGFNLFALIIICLAITWRLFSFIKQRRQGRPGAKLRLRLVIIFIAITLPSASIIYLFSLQFLNRSIDNWFNVEVAESLENALEFGQLYLDDQAKSALQETRSIAEKLKGIERSSLALNLTTILNESNASELAIFGERGNLIATSFKSPSQLIPTLPEQFELLQVASWNFYVTTEPSTDNYLRFRLLLTMPKKNALLDDLILQAIFPIKQNFSTLAASIETQYENYQRLAFLQKPLNISFSIILTLVLVFGVLLSVMVAFTISRRLVKPLYNLSQATNAIASGNYKSQISPPSNDEIGFLVKSFNTMAAAIDEASENAKISQKIVEEERAYLQTVLSKLTSGVITVDKNYYLQTYNTAAEEILELALEQFVGKPLSNLNQAFNHVEPLIKILTDNSHQKTTNWQSEISIFCANGKKNLICRGTLLTDMQGNALGHVLVFEDVTLLLKIQRQAAWGEVARRLAHEVKNPLTPIQLAAERLRYKCMPVMDEELKALLDKCTNTIVAQVDSLKKMVDDFANFAKPTQVNATEISLIELINEVVNLYKNSHSHVMFVINANIENDKLKLDRDRMRQVLNNIIQNALFALEKINHAVIEVSLHHEIMNETKYMIINIKNNGPSIPTQFLHKIFDPYVTTKPSGTGLGLSIVKKIIEDHGGTINVHQNESIGVYFVIQLPIDGPEKVLHIS